MWMQFRPPLTAPEFQDSKLQKRGMSVGEQNIERSLTAPLWQELCDEIQNKCRSINSVARRKMIIVRQPLAIAVPDMNTRKLLRLSYQETGPRISCIGPGKPDSNVTFRLEKTSIPSATLIYCGMPKLAQDLAVNMMIGLTRF